MFEGRDQSLEVCVEVVGGVISSEITVYIRADSLTAQGKALLFTVINKLCPTLCLMSPSMFLRWI